MWRCFYWGLLGEMEDFCTIFILLNKIVVDVDKINAIPQFSLMLPGEE